MSSLSAAKDRHPLFRTYPSSLAPVERRPYLRNMRELDRILSALRSAASRGESVVLATVMNVEGSVYRGTGARMIVAANADTIGAVSGGCLEADIVARAPEVESSGRPELVRYDTRASDDVVLGLGLGCQGLIDVLLEPLGGVALESAIAFYDRLAKRREGASLLTLLRSTDATLSVGTRLVLNQRDEVIEGDERILAHADDLAREVVRPAISLVVCGAGADAIPLVRMAKLMGMHVTVVDHRAAFATPTRFPDADDTICINLSTGTEQLDGRLALDEHTMAVVMAHSAVHDRAYLQAMLYASAGYIGVLGPRRRAAELLGGVLNPDSPFPPNVYSPVGLDLGAETPDEIALSIVAELTAVTAGRRAGMLREKTGPIHDRR
jgi:xanthine dehydrogenase accessory factor